MNLQKRISAFLLTVVLIISVILTGCNNNSTATQKPTQASQQTETHKATEATTTTEAVIQTEPVGTSDSKVFDNAVIVGDSITLKLDYYCQANETPLKNSVFLPSGSLGWTNAQWDIDNEAAVHPTYKGSTVLVENCAEITGAKYVIIMLGMNDIGLYGIDDSISSAKSLIEKIKANSPEVKIYVESVTPILAGMQRENLNNENVRAFNEKLSDLTKELNVEYLDLYPLFADENGNLRDEYCGDPQAMGIHFTDAACELWADYLQKNVK
ncbi:MAG: GDSL-type esterase/lipase family protein [Acutalibacteraceae bacterium]